MLRRLFNKLFGESNETKRKRKDLKVAKLYAMLMIDSCGGKAEIPNIKALRKKYEGHELTISSSGKKKTIEIRRKNNG